VQDRLARLTKDATLIPGVRPTHLSLAPLTAIDATDEAEPVEASLPELTPVHAPASHEHRPEPVNGHRAEAMNDGGMERRTGKDRRENASGSTLFTGPERRMGVFGRRHLDQYETSGRK
jgi:hypothetical protein